MSICPGYISNKTADICVGDILITSPDFAYFLLFIMIVIFGSVWAYIIYKKSKQDAVYTTDEAEAKK